MRRSKFVVAVLVFALMFGLVNVAPARAEQDMDGDGDYDLFDVALESLAENAEEIADWLEPYVAPYIKEYVTDPAKEYITDPIKNWWNGTPESEPEPEPEKSWWWPF